MGASGAGYSNAHAQLILDSYQHWTGAQLMEVKHPNEAFLTLYHAPIVVLSHGTEADPILNFGNAAALKLWEMNREAFTQMPSRQTAEPMSQADRSEFMQTVTEQGYITDYSGIRISRTGKRFLIRQTTVWNLVDPKGVYRGQAAAFSSYSSC
ncbi:MEKHLA domain-containing protein [Marinicrinis sediminis]|uniref:MEKHLA domain-containing protein n=1 Tax=Marinicrinis sediminis TaxID=1652465 RepID=A0ABW5REW1_9BACL